MIAATRTGVLWLAFALAGCSGRERPPFLDMSDDGKATGGFGVGGTTAVAAGGASSNGDHGLGPFDPSIVYIFGTLAEGSCSADAISRLDTPNDYAIGFDCVADGWTAQIHDGKLYYMAGISETDTRQAIREFAPDLFSSADPSAIDPPTDPMGNDPILDTPACRWETGGPASLRAGPEGLFAYLCPDGWHDLADDKVLYGGDWTLRALGHGKLALLSDAGVYYVEQLPNGAPVEIPELSLLSVYEARASNDGFYVVTTSDTAALQLWNVTSNGSTERLGAYPSIPEGTSASGPTALGVDGTFYRTIEPFADTTDSIVRQTIDGDSETVYTEANAWVKLHASDLFTGP